jgi:hypothetical protein
MGLSELPGLIIAPLYVPELNKRIIAVLIHPEVGMICVWVTRRGDLAAFHGYVLAILNSIMTNRRG